MKTKTLKYLVIALTLIGGFAYAEGEGTVISSKADYQAGLGDGWDQNKQVWKGRCLKGNVVAQGTSMGTANFEQQLSYAQLEKELGVGAAGRARFGIVSTSAAAKFLSNSKSDSYSITAIYSATYEFKNLSLIDPEISPEMKAIAGNDDKWETACGYEYVQQLKLGAKIFFSIRIDFASTEEKRAFEASFSASAPLWSVSANLKTASKQFSKRTTVTISTLQIGGEVDKISGIYGDKDALISCSIGEFEHCRTVLVNALKYATDEFPKQIAKETHTSTEGTGPVVISYLTKPYYTAGIFPKAAPELRLEIKRARLKLNQYLSEWHEKWVFANRYGRSGGRRLSARQMAGVDFAKNQIDENVMRIVTAAQECYDNPYLGCVEAVNELNPGQSGELKAIDPTTFVIENETFAQFCDDGVSPNPFASSGLKRSIEAYIGKAKEIKGEAFLPPTEGAPVDECFVTGTVLAGVKELNLSGRHISDIRPLMEFSNLETLDLSDNDIESLEDLELPFGSIKGVFPKLHWLNLHHNTIRGLKGIQKLASLSNLNVSNNKLESADELKVLAKLEYVDLRNNSQDLKVALAPSVIVLTADHGSSPQSVEIARETAVKRFAHQASRLTTGEVFISGGVWGGASTKGAEVFIPSLGDFKLEPGMNEARVWHSQTVLKDGRVFIAGGLNSNTAEIYDPKTRRYKLVSQNMVHARAAHTATLLPDGRVLLTGGWRLGTFGDTNLSAEIFDPATEKFAPLSKGLSYPRAGHTATLLEDGRVLLVGGLNDLGSSNSADIYDPSTGLIEALERRMQEARGWHTATILPNGQVLIVGGILGDHAHASAELFDPISKRFNLLAKKMKHSRMGHQAVLMSTGVVVITGGSSGNEEIRDDRTCRSCTSTVELYDSTTRDFVLSNYSLTAPRVFHSMTETKPNHFLIVGGLGKSAPDSAEILGYSSPNHR